MLMKKMVPTYFHSAKRKGRVATQDEVMTVQQKVFIK
jgi:hypothetical protein